PIFAVALVAVLVATVGQTQTPPPSSGGASSVSITSLVDQTVALFPQVEGDVAEVQGQTVTIAIGRKAGAQPGLVLESFREGREIRHPKTGAVLGKSEES